MDPVLLLQAEYCTAVVPTLDWENKVVNAQLRSVAFILAFLGQIQRRWTHQSKPTNRVTQINHNTQTLSAYINYQA
jgi:hypothetical protein